MKRADDWPGPSLGLLDTLDGYRRHFMDAGTWQPYVRLVCMRHGLSLHPSVRSGLPGTYPTFIVDDRWVVKFCGRLFDGGQAFEAELEANRLLAPEDGWPTAALVAHGEVFENSADWPWPYLIFAFIPGISYGEVRQQVAYGDKLALARSLGALARRLHELPIADSALFRPTWAPYRDLLQEQRRQCTSAHRAWQTLPAHLIEQIEAFLPPIEALVDWSSRPHLIHADLTGDHILGRLDGDHWSTLGIIDWGDAMVGDVTYELIALHLDLFQSDKRLLAAFLDAYGLDELSRATLPARALSVALLHRFNVLTVIFELYPQAGEIATLEQLAAALWDIHAPGLEG